MNYVSYLRQVGTPVSSANEADCHDVTEIGIIVGSVVNTTMCRQLAQNIQLWCQRVAELELLMFVLPQPVLQFVIKLFLLRHE
jgi:hypothetical protein